MNRTEFETMLLTSQARQKKLLSKKGRRYSSSFNVLSQFTECGKRLNLNPLEAWGVLYDKHEQVVRGYIAGKCLNDEDLSSVLDSIDDTINYLHLLEAFVKEEYNVCTDDGGKVAQVPNVAGLEQEMGSQGACLETKHASREGSGCGAGSLL